MSGYTIPYVTTRSDRGGERTVDIYSRLLADRIVYLGTAIDDGVANAVIAQLLHLANENSDTPIALYLNSPGGSLPATLAIYDAMQFVRPRVETTCVGQAAASAALLLAGGAPGGRQILPHGRVVIHAPAAEGRGTIPDLILEADEVARVRLLQEELLARHTGRTPEQIRSDLERDLILTPAEAVRFGVVDRVLTPQRVQAARQTGPRTARVSRELIRRVNSATLRSRAPATAASNSEDGSFSPRSSSERYCGDSPARPATSTSRSARSRRSSRNCSPSACRHSGSAGSVRRSGRSGTTSPMATRYSLRSRLVQIQPLSTAVRIASARLRAPSLPMAALR